MAKFLPLQEEVEFFLEKENKIFNLWNTYLKDEVERKEVIDYLENLSAFMVYRSLKADNFSDEQIVETYESLSALQKTLFMFTTRIAVVIGVYYGNKEMKNVKN